MPNMPTDTTGPRPTRTIALALFDGLTALDLVGPLQVLGMLEWMDPSFEVVVVGGTTDPIATDTRLSVSASHTFDEVPAPAAILVPGGAAPALAACADEPLLDWIRGTAPGAEWVTSVCTGSLILGAAGVLKGRRAACHWGFRRLLPAFGAVPVAERWVEDGKYVTAAGVSAGIDMALLLVERLAGAEASKAVQLNIEYDPHPPLGPIDWSTDAIPAFDSVMTDMVKAGLADHPELAARLLGA